MAGWSSALITAEIGDLADDVRRLFEQLDRQAGHPRSAAAVGQCMPPLDVLETDEVVEIVVDIPGVPISALRLLLKGSVVVVAGEKLPLLPEGPGDFHLVERASGRFARAVRVTSAFDGGRVRATLTAGELRIVLPKIHDRRGQARPIPIDHQTGSRRS